MISFPHTPFRVPRGRLREKHPRRRQATAHAQQASGGGSVASRSNQAGREGCEELAPDCSKAECRDRVLLTGARALEDVLWANEHKTQKSKVATGTLAVGQVSIDKSTMK